MTNERRERHIKTTAWLIGWTIGLFILFTIKATGWSWFWQLLGSISFGLFWGYLVWSLLSALAPWAPEE